MCANISCAADYSPAPLQRHPLSLPPPVPQLTDTSDAALGIVEVTTILDLEASRSSVEGGGAGLTHLGRMEVRPRRMTGNM